MIDSKFENKQRGKREFKQITMSGRIAFDLMVAFKTGMKKYRSYSLNAIASINLGDQKEDVHHSIIADLWRKDDAGRSRLCSYCYKDALLVIRLMNKLSFLTQYAEMARVCGIPMSYLISKGQQIKVMGQLLRKTRKENYIVPYIPVPKDKKNLESYIGAIVIPPVRKFHNTPVSTLDFNSLYPSIMMAHNLCYTTLIQKQEAETNFSPDDYTITPAGHYFLKSKIRQGLLPSILDSLLGARKIAKKDMAYAGKMAKECEENEDEAENWRFKYSVQDGRQLALKISANSVYGFTGATIGKLPCIPISSSVTTFGRQMIELTKKIVEDEFTAKKIKERYDKDVNGDARVIYGDTDSVMIIFHVKTIAEAMDMGKKAVDIVNKSFIKPINLAFEKVYYPYLLINKKRYIGGYWETSSEKMDKVDAKGVESVRRDNCQLVSETIKTVSNILMSERDTEKAVQYAKNVISELLKGNIDPSKLVISKGYTKEAEEYKSKQAHIELVKRIRERTPDQAPKIGDRIPYIVVPGLKGSRAFEKVEDPVYALENEISVDVHYYLENQLKKPLIRIFAPILGKPGETKEEEEAAERVATSILFAGDHTRHLIFTTPKNIGISKFCVETKKCLSCGVLGAIMCQNCIQNGKAEKCRNDKKEEVDKLEERKVKLWNTCEKCQGSEDMVLCTNRDCEIFYERTMVKKKYEREQQKLDSLLW